MNLFLNLLSEGAEPNVIDRLQSYAGTAEQTIAQQQISDPDYWGSVGIITLTGILVVFLILALLIFFFWLLGTLFKAVDKSKKKKQEAAAAAKAQEAVQKVVEEPVVEEASEVEDDGELIAVISAAIAAYTDDEGFTIKSVRKHDGKRARSAWSAAGITENTRPF